MSAQLDQTQKPQFYFGNAIKDLANELPRGDEENEQASSLAGIAEINDILDRSVLLFAELKEARERLTYLIADLKRSL